LRKCYHCDTRRTPNYLLAILRNVAAERREREGRARAANRKSECRRVDDEAHRRACQHEEQQRARDPRAAAERAIDLARVALANGGHGLSTASSWLRQALTRIASRGQIALEVNVSQLSALTDTAELQRWLQCRVDDVQPSNRSIREDLHL
jgi:hypothetical protein